MSNTELKKKFRKMVDSFDGEKAKNSIAGSVCEHYAIEFAKRIYQQNKIHYQDMLNTIISHKINKDKTPELTNGEISAWNNAIELCYSIAERRRVKFESKD